MAPRALLHTLLVAVLGVVLAQAGAACAMPLQPPAAQAAMSDGPCHHDRGAGLPKACPMICPLACLVLPSAAMPRRAPFAAPVRFDEIVRALSSLRLAPDDPPPR